MHTNMIYVTAAPKYSSEKPSFRQRKYIYFLHSQAEQIPNKVITINDFLQSMIDFISIGTFNTMTHNCHHARYFAMAAYGMQSDNPDHGKLNIFLHGMHEFFRTYENLD